MKHLPLMLALVFGMILAAASGCAGDPNVEGAKLDLRNRDYDRALQNIATALERNPENAPAYELKARVLASKAGDERDHGARRLLFADMVEAMERATSINPALQGTIAELRFQVYAEEFQRGAQAFEAGQTNPAGYANAALIFENVTTIEPDTSAGYVNLAYALLLSGQQSDAIAPLERAIDLGNTDADNFIYLSSLYAEANRLPDAVRVLERARDLHPANAEVQDQLLSIYVAAGQMDRAIAFYAQAVEREPENALYRYNFGSLLLQTDRFDEAVIHLQEAFRLDNNSANTAYNLGAAFINQAVAVNDQVREMDDELRENRRTLSVAQINQREDAIEALVERRTSLFQMAIAPLERALELQRAAGEETTSACVALFQSYTNTQQLDRAQSVAACAGFED